MHKNMNLLVLRHKFQQNLLNLLHIFDRYTLFALISRLDGQMWPKFSHRGVRSVILCIHLTYVPVGVGVVVVVDGFIVGKFWFLLPPPPFLEFQSIDERKEFGMKR